MIKSLFKIFKDKNKEAPPLFNILTRTSGRPNGFKKCHKSLLGQTYKNFRHIVSFDTPGDLEYINNYQVDTIRVYKEPNKKYKTGFDDRKHEPYNLYCNDLLKEVSEGWIMFLDDDDMLRNKNVLKILSREISKFDEDTLFLWQTRFPNGVNLPSQLNFENKRIVKQQIDTACLLFHSKYKDKAIWDEWWAADFRFIDALAKEIPNHRWISKVLTQKNNFGGQGKRKDISD